ncbi:MAG: hypothetical protein GXO07_01595 [Crenarchaeota archaeon]|nr:hypothetical protein [Thermoproteota archaeon]
MALALLLLALPASAVEYAVTSFPTQSVAYLVGTATLTSPGSRVVSLVVPLGFYNYVYVYTEPFTTEFTVVCSGSATLAFLTPTAVVTAGVIATVVSNVSTVVYNSTVVISLPSYFYYLLGGTESTSYALVETASLSTLALSTVTAEGTGVLRGEALLIPNSYVVCTYTPAPVTTVVLIDGRKVTLGASLATRTAPLLATAEYPLPGTVTTAFPVSASVSGATVQWVYEFVFRAPRPAGAEIPASLLLALGLASLLRRYAKKE